MPAIAIWVSSDRSRDSSGHLDAIKYLILSCGDDKAEIKKLLPLLQTAVNDDHLLPEIVKPYGELGRCPVTCSLS